MKSLVKYWHQDKEGMISLLILLAIVIMYLAAMALWILYEWNKPVTEYKIYDLGGHALALQLSRKIYRKLFHKDKG
jgi:hypothetical protein